jgi:hypothetical protein
MTWFHLAAWLPMIPLAIANGALRDLWYGRRMDELRAHQVATMSALALFTAYMAAVFAWHPVASGAQALAVGAVWFLLTIAFEFLVGHFVARHPWRRLLHDYDLAAGRVWVSIPLWLLLGPWVLFRLQCGFS